MMPCDYLALDGGSSVLDLDAVYDEVGGRSGKRDQWSAPIVFDPKSRTFVELRSSPPDIRGGSVDEAEAATESYIAHQFSLAADQLLAIQSQQAASIFLDRRSPRNGRFPPFRDAQAADPVRLTRP